MVARSDTDWIAILIRGLGPKIPLANLPTLERNRATMGAGVFLGEYLRRDVSHGVRDLTRIRLNHCVFKGAKFGPNPA